MGQQLSVKAAATIAQRVDETVGGALQPESLLATATAEATAATAEAAASPAEAAALTAVAIPVPTTAEAASSAEAPLLPLRAVALVPVSRGGSHTGHAA